MKKLLLSSALSAVFATNALAQDFQYEADIVYARPDTDPGVSVKTYGLAGRFYFDIVDTSKGPLAEAAFLDKSSSIGLSFLRTEFSAGPFSGSGNTKLFDARIVTPTDWIIEANYTDAADDTNIFGVGVGKYISDQTEL